MRYSNLIILTFSVFFATAFIYDYSLDEGVSSISISEKRPIGKRDLGRLNDISVDGVSWFFTRQTGLLTLDLRIPPRSVYLIEDQRVTTLNAGQRPVLVNPVSVKGTISSGGDFVEATFRLKGELSDHWDRSVRTSLAVDLKGALPGLHMQKFSIMKLHSRQFPADLLFARIKSELGMITRDLRPVIVRVNGKDWGLMIAEEHWGDDFFINHKLPEGPIIKFGDHVNGLPYQYQAVHGNVNKKTRAVGKDIAKRYFYEPSSVAFSLKRFADEIALTEVFNSFHPFLFSNLRIYYNPIDKLLYPITSDQDIPTKNKSFEESQPGYYITGLELHGLIGRLFAHNNFQDILSRSRAEIRESIYAICARSSMAIAKEFPIGGLQLWSQSYCDIIHYNAQRYWQQNAYPLDFVRKTMSTNELLKSSVFLSTDGVKINFSNGLDRTFLLEKLEYGGVKLDAPRRIYPNREGEIRFINDFIPPIGANIKVSGRIGTSKSISFEAPLAGQSKITKKHYKRKSGPLIVHGETIIYENTTVDGLVLNPNSTLKIVNGSTLFVVGSMQVVSGAKSRPKLILEHPLSMVDIIMSGQGSVKSVVNGLEVVSTSRLDTSSGSAALRFYGGMTEISDLTIDCPGYEDCLNLVNTSFRLVDSSFKNCTSDCIDIDHSDGVITGVTIDRARGDGIDFSRARVELFDIKMSDISDKGLSIGERSEILVRDLKIDNANACVVVKDGSNLRMEDFSLHSCKIFSIAAYVKKNYFEQPSLKVKDGKLDGRIALEQPNVLSMVGIDSSSSFKRIILSHGEIERFYKDGFMKKIVNGE